MIRMRSGILLPLLIFSFSLSAQSLDDLGFGTDSTLDVVTWNIEWFPKNAEITPGYVSDIMEAIDADVFAIQEVDNVPLFEQMVANLEGGYVSNLESSYFGGLAYVYKSDVIEINNIYEIYTTQPYWRTFPRSPQVMDMTYKGERFIIFNNHFKCCGDGVMELANPDDEETRRYRASNLLKEYIDLNFPTVNAIVTGDLNDILTDNPQNNIFQAYFDDEENYLFADNEIAQGAASGWSYPSWPSHLDHMLITNELFDDFENEGSEIATILVDNYLANGWEEYDAFVSDHRPVGLKLEMNEAVATGNSVSSPLNFTNYPNPFSFVTTFFVDLPYDSMSIEITNLKGQRVNTRMIEEGEIRIEWNAESLPGGIYFAHLKSEDRVLASTKIVLVD